MLPLSMAVQKISIALDEAAHEAAKRCAEREGMSLSAWLSRAATKAAQIEDGLAAVAEYEAEHGSFSEAELARADAILDAAAQFYAAAAEDPR